MASVKDLRNKSLSSMSTQELKDYIKKAEKAGFSISKSKDLGKAVDLLKVQNPSGYGEDQVRSAREKLMVNTTTDTQRRLGLISGASGGSFSTGGSPASIDLNRIYEDAMNSEEIRGLESELLAKQQARDKALADVNDNPFYSEATRVGKQRRVSEQSTDEISTLEGALAQRKADAQVKVNIATQQYNIESQEYQNNLNKLNMLISSGAITNASGSDIAQIAMATGMSTDMVKGIIDTTKTNQQQIQLSTNDAGTVTAFDARTGQVLYNIPGIGNAQGSGSSGNSADDKRAKAFESAISSGISQLKDGETWGTVWTRIKQLFPEVPNEYIDNMLGTSWREAGAFEEYQYKRS